MGAGGGQMSTIHSGSPDVPGTPPDIGEFRSQQGVTLGWVSAIEQIMSRLREYYIPETTVAGKRVNTTWQRGNVPGKPIVTTNADPLAQPNYFIGEQNWAANHGPQALMFARGPVSIRPTMRVGYEPRTGYKQICNSVYTSTCRIWSFDDDDGEELFNFLIAAAYREFACSTQGSDWDNIIYAPKRESTAGTYADVTLKIGIPVFVPPYIPTCVQQINQEAKICLPTS
jgi:hypothetical protein